MNLTQPNQTFRTWLSNTLLTGLVVLVPLGLTVYVLDAIIGTADRVVDFLPEFIAPKSQGRIPGTGLLIAFVVTLLAGILARNFTGRLIGRVFMTLLMRVPVVAGLYKLFRQISETFLGGGGKGFKSVVLVEWPRRGTWTLAFVTGEIARDGWLSLPESEDKTWLNLFVPTTPNPTSGFYFIVPKSDVRPTPLSVEAAFKVIISAGALHP
jgi:uncharacterized membrane protein